MKRNILEINSDYQKKKKMVIVFWYLVQRQSSNADVQLLKFSCFVYEFANTNTHLNISPL